MRSSILILISTGLKESSKPSVAGMLTCAQNGVEKYKENKKKKIDDILKV